MQRPAEVKTKSCAAWSLSSEIDWGAIDVAAARLDAEILMMVRRAALRAARRTVGISHLVAALAADSMACALLARELHDSWKHFHALRSYLEVAEYTPLITDAELEQHRRAASEKKPGRAEDAAQRVRALIDDAARDRAVFSLISSRALDPALARLADRVAHDRAQHSMTLARYLADRSASSNEKTA